MEANQSLAGMTKSFCESQGRDLSNIVPGNLSKLLYSDPLQIWRRILKGDLRPGKTMRLQVSVICGKCHSRVGWGRIGGNISIFFLNGQRRKHTERRKKKYLDVHLSSIHSRKVEKTLEVVARFQDIGLERKEQCGSGTTTTNTNTNLKTGYRTSGWLEHFGNTQMANNFSNWDPTFEKEQKRVINYYLTHTDIHLFRGALIKLYADLVFVCMLMIYMLISKAVASIPQMAAPPP